MMSNVFVAKQSIEIGYSNVGYIRKGSISVIQVKEMLVMARFTLPRDLYHGKGALEALKTFEGKRAIVCVGGGLHETFRFPGSRSRLPERSRHGSTAFLRESSLIRQSRLLCAEQKRWKSSSRTGS